MYTIVQLTLSKIGLCLSAVACSVDWTELLYEWYRSW